MPTLVLTSEPTLSLQALAQALAAQGLPQGAEDTAVATSSASLAPGTLPKGAYDPVLSLAPAAGYHSVRLLGILAAAVRPGGQLLLQEPGGKEDVVVRDLLLSGFTKVYPSEGGFLAARKPAWETGARAAISLRPKPKAAAAAAIGGAAAAAAAGAAGGKAAWTLAADGDEDLLDDEELLTEEDKQRPAPPTGGDDCDVGAAGRKACANCTCGRAEGEAPPEVKLTKEMLENPTSGGCGSCGLGDAFRCGTCPYKGLPSFEMGKPIQLAQDFLAADI